MLYVFFGVQTNPFFLTDIASDTQGDLRNYVLPINILYITCESLSIKLIYEKLTLRSIEMSSDCFT